MILTNFQWISPKIEDLYKLFVEISNCDFFCKNRQFLPCEKCENVKCEKFHENSGLASFRLDVFM